VTVTQLPITASATPSTICPGENVTLQASSSSSGTTNQNVTFSNTNSYAIPDNNTTGVSSPISVSGVNPSTINSSSIVSVTVNITHTYDGDLQLLLVSPSQNSIILSNRRGGSGDNYTNTVFTASAATAITSGSAPFTGSFRPEGLFSNLTGNVNGTWVLKAIDLAGNDIGTINNWTLSLNTVVPTTLSYSWTSTPPGFSASGSTATVTPAASTAYTVTVTESGTGCQNSQAVQVNVNSTMQLAVNNPSPICNGSSTTLNATGASTYVWSPATGLSSTTGSSVTANPSQTTTYTVQGTSGSCTDSRTVTVVVEEQALTPSGINGPTSGCSPFSAGYTVNGPVSGMTYSWTAPAGMNLSQPTGTNVNLTASGAATGNLCVAAGNSCGSSATRCMSVSVTGGAPTTPASIFGTSAVCPGDVVSYLAAVSTGATSYNWTIPSGTTIVSGQGTRTLNLQFNSSFTGGIISVVAVNSCGSSATTTRSLTLNPPSTPSVITGNGTGLCNLLEAFSVTATSGMSYVWTVPSGASIVSGQGTSAISVQFSSTFGKGSISVVAQNNCGTSTSRTKSVNGAPALPGPISGATVVCKGQNGVAYSIAPVYGANSYLWTMPRNTVIASGQGSTSILANYKTTASSGDVRVKASNTCSTTLNQKLAVTVNTCPRSSDEASSFTGEWSIVPNPASEQTKIVFGVKEDAIAEVNLTNVIGQSVYRQQIRTHAGNNSFAIDIRKLPRGVYFVTLTQNGESNSKRLVIE
jgi:subtilisin-like proprotein convertase family protein